MSIRLDDGEFELALRPVATPTPKRHGHWRIVYWFDPSCTVLGGVSLGNDEWLCPAPFPSEDVADMIGAREAADARARAGWEIVRYVRAEYFPDYPKGGA